MMTRKCLIAMIALLPQFAWAQMEPVARDPGSQSTLTPELRAQLERASTDEQIPCTVLMRGEYPPPQARTLAPRQAIPLCRDTARTAQAPLLAALRARDAKAVVKEFWVINGFHLRATSETIRWLAGRADVGEIIHDEPVRLIEPMMDKASPGLRGGSRAPEWNIQQVGGPACWDAGFTGQNIIVAITDTGCDISQPLLQGKWAGYWFDAINGQPEPYDDHGTTHGTFCTGLLVGGDGNGPMADDIGVAPGALFIPVKMLDWAGGGLPPDTVTALEWIADLKETVDIRVLSGSWGNQISTQTVYWAALHTLRTLGVFPVFAIGNHGPLPGVNDTPANYPLVLGVGAVDSDGFLPDWSCRGPAPNLAPWNDPSYWYAPDWDLIKPDLVAPGVAVRSLKSGQLYTADGTSFATPHVAGAAAILLSKNPTLTPTELYTYLRAGLDPIPQGAPYPNNEYGWGFLNAYASLQIAPAADQPVLLPVELSFADPAPGGNGNGELEAGELVELTLTLFNPSATTAYNTRTQIASLDNYVFVQTATVLFGDVGPGQTVSNAANPLVFLVHALTPPEHDIRLQLQVHGDGGPAPDVDWTKTYEFRIGDPPQPSICWLHDFEYTGGGSFGTYWTLSPANSWQWVSDASCQSPPHSAYSNGPGSTAYTMTMAAPFVVQSHRATLLWCQKWNFTDPFLTALIEIEARFDGSPVWEPLWKYSSLLGPSAPWHTQDAWLGAIDTLQLRVRARGNTLWGNYTRYWIDDLRIECTPDPVPPYFHERTMLPDTSDPGPYPVQCLVTDDYHGVTAVRLYWRADGGAWNLVSLTPAGGDSYAGQIPGQALGTLVEYYLEAADGWSTPNIATDPVGAPGERVYSFCVSMLGDLNCDGAVDADDLALFAACMAGPGQTTLPPEVTPPQFSRADLDDDGDVDLLDFATLQALLATP